MLSVMFKERILYKDKISFKKYQAKTRKHFLPVRYCNLKRSFLRLPRKHFEFK